MSDTRDTKVVITEAKWKEAAIERYGEDPLKWRFRCPVCGHVASVQDWKDAGAVEGNVAYSCIGRNLDPEKTHVRDALRGEGPGPCNYAGGGLFGFNPITVVIDPEHSSKTVQMFDFADRPLHPKMEVPVELNEVECAACEGKPERVIDGETVHCSICAGTGKMTEGDIETEVTDGSAEGADRR